MSAPLDGRRGRGDHVARGRAGRQHRVAGIARGVAVEPEGLDAVVVLVGDVGHRRAPAAVGCVTAIPPAPVLSPRRNRPAPVPVLPHAASQPPRGRLEDLHAIVLGVEHVDVAGAIGGQPADDADAPELAPRRRSRPARPATRPCGRSAGRPSRTGRPRGSCSRPGCTRWPAGSAGRSNPWRAPRPASWPRRSTPRRCTRGHRRPRGRRRSRRWRRRAGHGPCLVPYPSASRPPPRRARCTGSAPRRASRRSPAARPPGARRTRPRARAARAGRCPVPCPASVRPRRRRVVDDLDVDRARAAAHEHVHRRPRGVAQRVGQALAHDAVGRLGPPARAAPRASPPGAG